MRMAEGSRLFLGVLTIWIALMAIDRAPVWLTWLFQ